MKRQIRIVAVGFLFLLPGSAWAAEIITPALATGSSPTVNCRVLNTGGTIVHNVTIQIFDAFGNTESSNAPFTIGAGSTVSMNDATPSGIAYCRVSGISKSKARVTLCLIDATGTCTTAVIGQ